eukprot:scaffold23509_cov107-Isochrysis_galbana.AAC.1
MAPVAKGPRPSVATSVFATVGAPAEVETERRPRVAANLVARIVLEKQNKLVCSCCCGLILWGEFPPTTFPSLSTLQRYVASYVACYAHTA